MQLAGMVARTHAPTPKEVTRVHATPATFSTQICAVVAVGIALLLQFFQQFILFDMCIVYVVW